MEKKYYFKIIVFLTAAIFVLVTGCAKKETVIESSSQPQNEMKQESVAPPNQEATKPVPAAAAVKPVTEGEQKVAVTQTLNTLEDIHFDFDQDILRPEDRTILNAHANWLMKNPEYQVKIEGNCDERGTEEYNMALGQRRADEAKTYLMNMGIDKKRISTISYGNDRPVASGHDEESRAKNRNDHFVLRK